MAGTDTITVYRGEAVTLGFAMAPVESVQGWTLLFTVEGVNDSGVIGKLIEMEATPLVAASGTFRVALTASGTDIRAGVYQYDVWRTDAGAERPIAVGPFVIEDVARLPVVLG